MSAFDLTALALAVAALVATAGKLALLGRLRNTAGELAAPAAAGQPLIVLRPILAQDPQLAETLWRNLTDQPGVEFHWLLDAADGTGLAVAAELLARLEADPLPATGAAWGRAAPGVAVCLEIFGPAPAGVNPKSHKLERAVERLAAARFGPETVVCVLDDDTVLAPGDLARSVPLLRRFDLVTGVPYYRAAPGFWSALLAALVNAQALLTYLPMAAWREPITINGMWYITSLGTLRSAGGFGPIRGEVCDDYALARLYRDQGLSLGQSLTCLEVSTTVVGAGGYWRVLRRWLRFAGHLFAREFSPPIVLLVLLPAVLPGLAVTVAVVGGGWPTSAAVLGLLLARSWWTARIRWHLTGQRPGVASGWRQIGLELFAEVLLPVQFLASRFGGAQLYWRGRDLAMVRGRVVS